MDINKLLQKLTKSAPGTVLEKSRFGKAGSACLWVDTKGVASLATTLRDDPELELDWLENLSVAEVGDALLVTYFLRSTKQRHQLLLRGSLAPADITSWVEMASVAEVWPMAEPLEREMGELFGIRFMTSAGKAIGPGAGRLPENWVGFPMRKKYTFPAEVLGIRHERQAVAKAANLVADDGSPEGGA